MLFDIGKTQRDQTCILSYSSLGNISSNTPFTSPPASFTVKPGRSDKYSLSSHELSMRSKQTCLDLDWIPPVLFSPGPNQRTVTAGIEAKTR